jgi:hypothetical protein
VSSTRQATAFSRPGMLRKASSTSAGKPA